MLPSPENIKKYLLSIFRIIDIVIPLEFAIAMTEWLKNDWWEIYLPLKSSSAFEYSHETSICLLVDFDAR